MRQRRIDPQTATIGGAIAALILALVALMGNIESCEGSIAWGGAERAELNR